MKDEMYAVINKVFGEFVDGRNKDGVFITVDEQQYNIKIVAKKKPVLFGDEPEIIEIPPHTNVIKLTDEMIEEIKTMFEGLVDDV